MHASVDAETRWVILHFGNKKMDVLIIFTGIISCLDDSNEATTVTAAWKHHHEPTCYLNYMTSVKHMVPCLLAPNWQLKARRIEVF